MVICKVCQKECATEQGFKAHWTMMHTNIKTTGIEEQLADLALDSLKQLELNDQVLQIVKAMIKRLLAVEKANEGLENSMIELIKRMEKHWLALAGEIQAEAKASCKRDDQLLERLNEKA